MPRIEIGAGVVLAVLATFGVFGSIPVAAVLLAFGVLLVLYGGYEEWVKPRFRVEHRLTDWLLRRGWSVRIERLPEFNFALHLISSDSEKHILVTRNKGAINDVLAFTARVGIDPRWIPQLLAMSQQNRSRLIQEITILAATKDIGLVLNDPRIEGSPITWPPDVKLQTALPQDHTLSEHLVDMTAKKIEMTMIGVRAIIRKALVIVPDDDDDAATLTPTPSHESTPGTASPQPPEEL